MALTPAQMRALKGGVPTQPTRRVDTSTLAGVRAASAPTQSTAEQRRWEAMAQAPQRTPARGTAQQQAQAAAHRADTQRAQDAVYANRAAQQPSNFNVDDAFGPPGGPAPKPDPKPAPKPDPKPTPKPDPKPEPKPDPKPEPPPKPIDWRDAAYNAQIAAANRALQDYETGAVRGVQRFGEDFMRGLGSLGYTPEESFQAAPDITQFRDLTAMQQATQTPASRMGGARGSWDYEGERSPFSSAARGTRSSRDEFAGRGTLRSSDFAQSYAEFQDRLNEQLTAMQTGRTRTLEDALSGLVGQRGSAEEQREAARLEAVNRAAIRAAEIGTTVTP